MKYSQARELMVDCMIGRLVPLLAGSPGVGKSALAQSIADEYNLLLIDYRLGQCDPTDLMGFPQVKNGKAAYAPMEVFPMAGDELPLKKAAVLDAEGNVVTPEVRYDGWLLFLDELTSAPRAVQAAAYKLVLDRMVGNHKLHEQVAIMAAGNKETDGAIVTPMGTAMQSRLVHLELDVDHKEWVDWAVGAGVDFRITSFINYKPDNLYRFDPNHNDKTFACPRTWGFVDALVSQWPAEIPASKRAVLDGTISAGMAHEFMAFCKIFDSLVTVPQIVANPTGIAVPDEPSQNFALAGSIANHADKDNIDELMVFVSRMNMEFQIICLQDLMKRDRTMLQNPNIKAWLAKNAKELF